MKKWFVVPAYSRPFADFSPVGDTTHLSRRLGAQIENCWNDNPAAQESFVMLAAIGYTLAFFNFLRFGGSMGKNGWLSVLLAMALFLPLGGCSKVDPAQNQKAGESFLAQNGVKPGVTTTPSGLQYQVLNPGKGLTPAATDSVTVNYKGSLITGKEFDSGENITFPLNGVIPGWTEGLQLMKEGASYRFFIPSALAYGESGAARVIPPNAALIFDVDLVKVNR